MDGQLVQPCHSIDSPSGLIALVETLRLEVAELRADVQRLHRENNELRQDAGYWRSRHRDALQRIAGLDRKVENEGENASSRPIFGRRTETTTRSDRSNHLGDPRVDSQEPQRKRGQQPENAGPKRRDYSHLPVRERRAGVRGRGGRRERVCARGRRRRGEGGKRGGEGGGEVPRRSRKKLLAVGLLDLDWHGHVRGLRVDVLEGFRSPQEERRR